MAISPISPNRSKLFTAGAELAFTAVNDNKLREFTPFLYQPSIPSGVPPSIEPKSSGPTTVLILKWRYSFTWFSIFFKHNTSRQDCFLVYWNCQNTNVCGFVTANLFAFVPLACGCQPLHEPVHFCVDDLVAGV